MLPDDHASLQQTGSGTRRAVAIHGVVLLLVAVSMNLSALTTVVLVLRWQAFSLLLGQWVLPIAGCTALGATLSLTAFFIGLARWLDGRWCERSLLLVRVFGYSMAAAWLMVVFLVSPANPSASARLVMGLGGAIFGGVALARMAAGASEPARWARTLDLVACNLCLLAVAAEGGLRLLSELRPSVLLMRPGSGVAESVAAARYAQGTVRHGFPVNSNGHYDEEFLPLAEGEQLVVSIGDSFSASIVHHSLHFTTVAERALPQVVVYNMGFPSIGPREYHFLAAREALPLKPQLLVVNLFVGNDLYYPLPSVEENGPLPSLFDTEQLLSVQVPRRLLRVAAVGRGGVEALEGSSGGDDGEGIASNAEEVRRLFPWTADPSLEEPRLNEGHFISIERHAAERLAAMTVAEIEERLRPLAQLAAMARDCEFAVMIIPDRFQVEDELWRQLRTAELSDEDRKRSLTVVRDWLAGQGIPYLDLLPTLRAVPVMADGSAHLYHRCDTHFNARGNHVAGAALAAFIAERLGLPAPSVSGSPS